MSCSHVAQQALEPFSRALRSPASRCGLVCFGRLAGGEMRDGCRLGSRNPRSCLREENDGEGRVGERSDALAGRGGRHVVEHEWSDQYPDQHEHDCRRDRRAGQQPRYPSDRERGRGNDRKLSFHPARKHPVADANRHRPHWMTLIVALPGRSTRARPPLHPIWMMRRRRLPRTFMRKDSMREEVRNH